MTEQPLPSLVVLGCNHDAFSLRTNIKFSGLDWGQMLRDDSYAQLSDKESSRLSYGSAHLSPAWEGHLEPSFPLQGPYPRHDGLDAASAPEELSTVVKELSEPIQRLVRPISKGLQTNKGEERRKRSASSIDATSVAWSISKPLRQRLYRNGCRGRWACLSKLSHDRLSRRGYCGAAIPFESGRKPCGISMSVSGRSSTSRRSDRRKIDSMPRQ